MQFLKEDTTPLVNSLMWYTFGHVECPSSDLYTQIYKKYIDNVKIINKALNGKKYLVGQELTICDIYLTLTQVEMMQCLMDSKDKNSFNFLNVAFK